MCSRFKAKSLKTIANQLRAKLSPREEAVMHEKPTSDMAAYDLYLQAREIWRNISTSSGSGGAEKMQEAIRSAGRRGSARSQFCSRAL